MKIKKIGHCCLAIETAGKTILTDPGAFSVDQNSVTGIDVVLITHEHGDHLHVESLKEVLKNNPNTKVITNESVGKILKENGIVYELISDKETKLINEMSLEAFDCKHEEIFEEIGQVQNTAFLIDNRLLYSGDSFFNPNKPVEILALPVAGPWCKIPDAVRYALSVKPKHAFPVHDGMIQKERIGSAHNVPQKILGENDIEFYPMTDGEELSL